MYTTKQFFCTQQSRHKAMSAVSLTVVYYKNGSIIAFIKSYQANLTEWVMDWLIYGFKKLYIPTWFIYKFVLNGKDIV